MQGQENYLLTMLGLGKPMTREFDNGVNLMDNFKLFEMRRGYGNRGI
jgi:hypothetical protein